MPPNDRQPSGLPEGHAAGAPAFWAVVPAGGSGTRLWPLSRSTRPKFLVPLLGDRSLLQTTVERLAPLAGPQRTIIVCGMAHAPEVARQLLHLPADHIIVEPSPRGTGPAVGLAAALIARRDPDAVMGSFAADHHVRDPAAFERAVRTAVSAASAGWLATLGIPATRPGTGYGYIERTGEIVAATDEGAAYRAARFVEKPDHARATEFVASGRFCWNTGMFVWSVRVFLAELARLQPELAAGLTAIADVWGIPDAERTLAEIWPTLPAVSVDSGVLERADRLAVVPVEMGRADVGDWHGLGEQLPGDGAGKVGTGDLLLIDSHRNVVWSETGRMVAVVGMDDVVIVDTEDALLITRRAGTQSVKDIVTRLKREGREHLV